MISSLREQRETRVCFKRVGGSSLSPLLCLLRGICLSAEAQTGRSCEPSPARGDLQLGDDRFGKNTNKLLS